MPTPDPRVLVNANVGSSVRPRSATRDLRASRAAPPIESGVMLSSKQMGVTGQFIRVFPAVAEFQNIDAGVIHVLTVTVLNRDDHARRIRIIAPRTREFTLHQIPMVAVAPGLEVSADLEFFSNEERDFLDEIVVICESDRIVIPVSAQAPRAELSFDGYCLFGAVPPGRTIIRYVDIVNNGQRAGDFCFLQDEHNKMCFTIEPLTAHLGPAGSDECTIRVKVSFLAYDLGPYRSVVDVLVNSNPCGLVLDMSALVVRQQFEIVSPDGTGQVSTVQLGTVYVGELRTSQVLLVNDGSDSVEFSVTIDEDVAGEHAENLFSASPSRGPIGPYEQLLITFTYSPQPPDRTKGFQCQPLAQEEEHAVRATFTSSDGNQQAQLTIKGKAVIPTVAVSAHTLRFIDTATNQGRDLSVAIKNLHEEMPINFTLNRIAHFHCRPSAGRLLPSQSMEIVVSFRPNQLGVHAGEFFFDLFGSSGQMVGQKTLGVSGLCRSEGPKRALIGGVKATDETFQPVFQFQAPDDLNDLRSKQQKSFKRTKPWEKYPPDVNEQTAMYTYDQSTFEEQHANKKMYQDYLQSQFKVRNQIEKVSESKMYALGGVQKNCGDPIEDPDYAAVSLDMGMFSIPVKGMPPGSCLKEPQLKLPMAEDPLYLKNTHAQTFIKPRARVIDENKLIRTKFKPVPTTQRETMECKAALNARSILQVSTSTSNLEFGSICIQAEVSKCFAVSNDTAQNILVTIDTHKSPVLSRCKPESQVVPPGGTAGFDITLYLDTPQEIDTKFSYTLNGLHTFPVRVKGSAVPVMLSVNRTRLNFTFPASSCATLVSESIKLVNPGSNPAEFRVENAGSFTAIPHEGSVEPNGAEEITITFTPGQLQRDEQALNIVVVGGSNLTLNCTGEVDESQIQTKLKVLDFGAIAAGCTVRKSISLQNCGACNAVFFIDPEQLRSKCPGLSIVPETGMIPPEGSVQLLATLRSERELRIDSYIVFNARGGKPTKIGVKASIQIPDVKILSDEVNFGPTSLGSRSVRQIMFANSSIIPAIFTIDFGKYPEFTVVIPEDLEYEDDGETVENIRPPQSTTPQIAMDSSIQKDSQGTRVKFRVPAEGSGTIDVIYAPISLVSHAFELPLTLQGLPPYAAKSLRRAVVTEALKPKLLISSAHIDFSKRVVIGERVADFAYNHDVVLTNCDDATMNVDVRLVGADADSGYFKMQPLSIGLDSSKSISLSIKFCPRTDADCSCSLHIYLEGSTSPYLTVPIRGSGVHPSLGFDRREIILPSVPLGQKTSSTFYVINYGYDNLNLRYQLPPDSSLVPLTIHFPQGTMVGVVKTRLPVQVTFESKKPISFNAGLDFLDADGKKYTISVIGTTDACILTTFPFLKIYRDFFEKDFKPSKPIMIQQTKEMKEPLLTAENEIIFADIGSTSNRQISQTNSSFLCECSVMNSDVTTKTVIDWSNHHIFRQAIVRFPGDLIETRGRCLVEVIEASTTKSVPGQNRKVSTNKREEAQCLVAQYTELFNFLKSYGALMSSIKPEFLLGYDYFQKLMMDGKSGVDMPDEHRPFFETYYSIICSASWLRLTYQVIKLFVLNRITPKLLRSLPGVDASLMQPFPTYTGSNVYSLAECVMLHWLNYHHSIIFPSEKLSVTNFDVDLHDCRVFSAVIASHLPSTKAVFAEMKKTSDPQIKLKNAKKLFQVVKQIGLAYCPPAEVLCSSPAHDLILFCIDLFNYLPGFIPKATIEFEGRLNDISVKNIELSNPSSKPLIYSIRIDGAQEFKAESTLKLNPRDRVLFPVTSFHSFRRDAEAQIFFIGERSSAGASGINLVFNLKSIVKSYKRSDVVKRSTRLYEPISIEIPVKGLSEETIELSTSLVELTQLFSNAIEQTDGRKGGQKAKGSKKAPLVVTSSPMLPSKAFWLKKDKVKLRKGPGASGTLIVNFLPLRLVGHSCLVFVKDENVGEYCIEVQVEVSLPGTTDSIKFSHPMKSTVCKDISLSTRSAAIDKCRPSIMELLGQQGGKDFFKAMSEQPILDYQVQYLSEYVSGPKVVSIGGTTAAQAASTNQRKTGPLNKLPLEVHPKGPGKYEGRIMLRSIFDIRVLDMDINVTFLGNRAELVFNCPVRHSVLQEIPIINQSEVIWTIAATLETDFFSGPKELQVPARLEDGTPGRASYPLTFSPTKVSSVSGQLILRNNTIGDSHEYQLNGIGEEPLAEDHIRINCRARWKSSHVICVRNILETRSVSYRVESDLAGLIGSDQITVPAGGDSDYEFKVMMPCGGHFNGSITFTTSSGDYIWYTVEVLSENPPAERRVKLSAIARTAVAASITISNPLDQAITMNVLYEGEGLLGPSTCELTPNDSTLFEVLYSPLVAGNSVGGVTFVNDQQGEFWYELELVCEDAEPIKIHDMQAHISKQSYVSIEIENPLGEDIEIEQSVTGQRNFKVVTPGYQNQNPERNLILEAYRVTSFHIVYSPSSINETEECTITLQHPVAGKWVYECRGIGLRPSLMETQEVSAAVGQSSSNVIVFKNPLSHKIICSVRVVEEKYTGAFVLILSSTDNIHVQPFKELSIPFLFSPTNLMSHHAEIEIRSTEDDVAWRFPVLGTAESSRTIHLGRITCKAREIIEDKEMVLELLGAMETSDPNDLELDVVAEEAHREMMARALRIVLDKSDARKRGGLCKVRLTFEPLKPIRSKIDLRVTQRRGGRWRFNLELVATQADIDDVIKIEGFMNSTSSVSFRLTNQFDMEAPFKAFFTPESPSEFSVSPALGILEKYGKEGTNFVISFLPRTYGKIYVGKLIIETEEMQWTYEVRGEHPKYEQPAGEVRVASRLPFEQDPDVYKARQPRHNYMKEHFESLKKASSEVSENRNKLSVQ